MWKTSAQKKLKFKNEKEFRGYTECNKLSSFSKKLENIKNEFLNFKLQKNLEAIENVESEVYIVKIKN